jgi:hypothetical protein
MTDRECRLMWMRGCVREFATGLGDAPLSVVDANCRWHRMRLAVPSGAPHRALWIDCIAPLSFTHTSLICIAYTTRTHDRETNLAASCRHSRVAHRHAQSLPIRARQRQKRRCAGLPVFRCMRRRSACGVMRVCFAATVRWPNRSVSRATATCRAASGGSRGSVLLPVGSTRPCPRMEDPLLRQSM